MDKNVIDSKCYEFVPGRAFRATVKKVCETGVMIKMPGGRGSGVIASSCWGTGVDRKRAFAEIRPGDVFDVVVRGYDARTMTLSLVLDMRHGVEPPSRRVKEKVRTATCPSHGGESPRKPDFVPIAADTTFLWDASNLVGAIGSENVAHVLHTIEQSLSWQGYNAMFFIERRCLTWALHNQRSPSEAAELETFARQGNVVVVGDCGDGIGEADCAILQMAEALPNSVCVSRDRFEDYAHAYPGIVGTRRIRSFSIAKAGGKTMVLVNGAKHAIVIEEAKGNAAVAPRVSCAAEPAATSAAATAMVSMSALPSPMTGEAECQSRRCGLLAVAEDHACHGDFMGAVRIYEKVAKRDPAAYRALARLYREGKAGRPDSKMAARYERLAHAFDKARKACSVRDRRRRSEAVRSGRQFVAHFAAKRRNALGFAIFGERHEMISEWRKFKHAKNGRFRRHGNAA